MLESLGLYGPQSAKNWRDRFTVIAIFRHTFQQRLDSAVLSLSSLSIYDFD